MVWAGLGCSGEGNVVADRDGPDHGIWALADLVTPMAMRVAATLRVADHITQGLRTASALAEVAHVDTDTLDRLLRHLVTAGVLDLDESGGYTLTDRGESLRDDHPSGMQALLDIDGAIGWADLSFVGLLHSVRTGEAAFPVQFGRPFWDDLGSDPRRTASFDAHGYRRRGLGATRGRGLRLGVPGARDRCRRRQRNLADGDAACVSHVAGHGLRPAGHRGSGSGGIGCRGSG